jgi:rhomboid protease GluP
MSGPVEVFTADSRAPVNDAALVLSAVGIDNAIQRNDIGWCLLVASADQAQAHQQLQSYWHENQPSDVQPTPALLVDSGWPGVIGYLIVIWSVPAASVFSQLDFFSAGRLDAGAVVNGEWWRTATALTLHADLGHIAANSLFGCAFGLFVGRYLGSGLGWMLVLACGVTANLANAYVQPEQFRAIGASTATFAALGIVPAFGWRRGFFRGRGFKRGFAPLFAAIALLAYTGFGSENVDALGHIFGFIAGIVMGLAVANVDIPRFSIADHQRAGFATLLIIATAWVFAFS